MGLDLIFEVHTGRATDTQKPLICGMAEENVFAVGELHGKHNFGCLCCCCSLIYRESLAVVGVLCAFWFNLECATQNAVPFWHAICQMSNRFGPISAAWLPTQWKWLTFDWGFGILFLASPPTHYACVDMTLIWCWLLENVTLWIMIQFNSDWCDFLARPLITKQVLPPVFGPQKVKSQAPFVFHWHSPAARLLFHRRPDGQMHLHR